MSLQSEQTLFGRIPEKNVYFLIDTSGSMQHQLGFVKSHLVEVEFEVFTNIYIRKNIF